MVLLLIILIVFLALIGLTYFFYFRLTKVKEALFGTRQELARVKARFEKTADAARLAEERWQQALGQLEQSLGNTDRALDIGSQIGEVSEQLHALTAYIMHPLDEPQQAKRGRHSMPANAAVIP
jgi:Tfp pilus assembly protein PilO